MKQNRIDPSIRLRRAIHHNDLILVRRIVKSNPHVLKARDYTDRTNTPLHLAAVLGLEDIAVRVHVSWNEFLRLGMGVLV